MRPKAIGLLSGGLDSVLAIRLVVDQGVEVVALNIVLPFVGSRSERAEPAAEWLGVRLVKMEVGHDYIEVLRNPRYGYGKGFNPCIDCRVYMLGLARRLMEQEGADFVVTGDVLKQRPKSQTQDALNIEDKCSGLKGLIVRPLSAKCLPRTVPELEGILDRDRFLGLCGKNRKPQLELAAELGLTEYGTPAGGCPLTNREFAIKARTLFSCGQDISVNDLALLRHGRHFYAGGAHIIVGKSQQENRSLLALKEPDGDVELRVPDVGSPVTILRGAVTAGTLVAAARLTAVYSDSMSDEVVEVRYSGCGLEGSIVVEQSAGEQAYAARLRPASETTLSSLR
ncbi:MAG: tRNA 4-thiouridine(8) synthase ThiI [Chloroflexi bacterium]|nr:tRNA 4-thiouridine(8) synthase ThiI [Chloroflexota bacterium]